MLEVITKIIELEEKRLPYKIGEWTYVDVDVHFQKKNGEWEETKRVIHAIYYKVGFENSFADFSDIPTHYLADIISLVDDFEVDPEPELSPFEDEDYQFESLRDQILINS